MKVTTATSSFELSTEGNHFVNASSASTPTVAHYYSEYALSIYEALMVAMGAVGTVANGFVLFVLVYYDQVRRSNTNKFICNQTVMDFIASLAMVCTTLPNSVDSVSRGESPLSWFICLIFSSNAALDAPVYASQAGLLVITLERYVKIVHPIWHRNRFRPWMVRAGVVLPWLSGIVAYIIPTWATTRMINGECWTYVWPTRDMFKAYVVFGFLYVFALPVGVFVFCYGRILSIIRRQSQVTVITVAPANSTVPRGLPGGHPERSAQTKSENPGVSQSQKKVIRTMIIVTAMYTTCWFPIQFYIVSIVLKWMAMDFNILFMLTVLGGVNIACNPIVYASHFDVVRRTALAVPRRALEVLRHHQSTTRSCFNCVGSGNNLDSSTDNEEEGERDSSTRTAATTATVIASTKGGAPTGAKFDGHF